MDTSSEDQKPVCHEAGQLHEEILDLLVKARIGDRPLPEIRLTCVECVSWAVRRLSLEDRNTFADEVRSFYLS